MPVGISGEMAEWSKATVLKTAEEQSSVGSNPTLSASLEYIQDKHVIKDIAYDNLIDLFSHWQSNR